ncbi:MAG: sialidase family protein [Myxococcaceae bacterium]
MRPVHVFGRSMLSFMAALWVVGCSGNVGTLPDEDGGLPVLDASVQDDAGARTDAGAEPDGGDVDAGADDAGSKADAGTGDGGRIPIFIAQGHFARTTLSCDLGRTWVGDRDEAPDNARCWEQPPGGGTQVECDHSALTARGLAFSGEYIFANYGWVVPGSVRRSRYGVDWETVQTGKTWANPVHVNGRLLFANNEMAISDDEGSTLTVGTGLWELGTVRLGGGGDIDGRIFVMSADNGIVVSNDGLQWRTVTAPSECRAILTDGGVVVGNGVIVVAGYPGVCFSKDRGNTWTSVSLPVSVNSTLVWTGKAFVFFGRTQAGAGSQFVRYSSADGETWTMAPITVRRPQPGGGVRTENGPALGIVAYGAGVFAAVNEEWGRYYENQAFYRSEDDGLTWDELPKSAFVGSHPINQMAFGHAERSSVCP